MQASYDADEILNDDNYYENMHALQLVRDCFCSENLNEHN